MGLLCMRWYHAHAAFVAQSRVVITMSTSARHKHERRSQPASARQVDWSCGCPHASHELGCGGLLADIMSLLYMPGIMCPFCADALLSCSRVSVYVVRCSYPAGMCW